MPSILTKDPSENEEDFEDADDDYSSSCGMCSRPDSIDKELQCYNCETWYHCSCVGVKPKEADGMQFKCVRCKQAENSSSVQIDVVTKTTPMCVVCSEPAVSDAMQCSSCLVYGHMKCYHLTKKQQLAFKTLSELKCFQFCCPCCQIVPEIAPCPKPSVVCKTTQTTLGESTPSSPNPKSRVHRPKVRIVQGANDPLSNFFMCRVPAPDGITYKSTEHALQCYRARSLGVEQDVLHKVMNAPSGVEAKYASRPFAAFCVRDDDAITLYELLKCKRDNCLAFREALRNSMDCELVHSTYTNDGLYWGSGLDHRDVENAAKGNYRGKNVLGKLLMKLRATLQDESSYTTGQLSVVDYQGVVVCIEEGEVVGKKVVTPRNFRSYSDVVSSNVAKKSGGGLPTPKAKNPTAGRVPKRTALLSTPPRSSSQRANPPPLLNNKPLTYNDTAHLRGGRCFNCSEPGHNVAKCRFSRPLICFRCKRAGHKVKFCSLISGNPNVSVLSHGMQQQPTPLMSVITPYNVGGGSSVVTNGTGKVTYGNTGYGLNYGY